MEANTRRRLFMLSPRYPLMPLFSPPAVAAATAVAATGREPTWKDKQRKKKDKQRKKKENGAIAASTFEVTLPAQTTWSWAVVAVFHLAERRLRLSQRTTVVFQVVDAAAADAGRAGSAYSVVNASTGIEVASGRVQVRQWAAQATAMYGKKRGSWWLNQFDSKEAKCWSLQASAAVVAAMSPAAENEGAAVLGLPPGILLLQQGLRNNKRQFVAMEIFTMADVLAFAYLHSIFSAPALATLLREQVPDVIRWFSRTQQQILPNLRQGDSDDVSAAALSVACLRAITADPVVPMGCGSFRPLPQWDAEAARMLLAPTLPIQEWRSEPKSSRGNKNNPKKIEAAIEAASAKLDAAALLSLSVPRSLDAGTVGSVVDWNALPDSLDPEAMMAGQKTDQRGRACSVRVGKKREQIESMLALILPLLPAAGTPSTAVEFAAGSGYIGLVLAALRPSVTVYIMDRAPVSVGYARDRAVRAGLTNVKFAVCDIRDFKLEGSESVSQSYDVGFALHACGEASDYALDHCVAHGAAYVIAPCCAGFIQNSAGNPNGTGASVERPTSGALRDAGLTRDEYLMIAAGADHSSQSEERGRKAMSILDLDRNLRAKEAWEKDGGRESEFGYHRMHPPSCTPKNQILVGKVVAGGDAAVANANAAAAANAVSVVAKPVHGGYPTRVPTAEEWVEVSSKKTLTETTKSEQKKEKKKKNGGGCVVQ